MKMLTVKEAAERLNVSRNMIYKLASSGEIEHHRIGGAIRFTEQQIHDFLEGTRVEKDSMPSELTHLDL